jgi:hypothetical protein
MGDEKLILEKNPSFNILFGDGRFFLKKNCGDRNSISAFFVEYFLPWIYLENYDNFPFFTKFTT